MGGPRVGLFLAVCASGVVGCQPAEESDMGGDAMGDPDDGAGGRSSGYDVGYVDDFTVAPFDSEVVGFIVVVNMGGEPLDLSTAEIVAFEDSSDLVEWSLEERTGSKAMLAPGRAAGYLSAPAEGRVLVDGVVTEPVDDQNLNFAMTFGPLPDRASFQAEARIRIGGLEAALPIEITVD